MKTLLEIIRDNSTLLTEDPSSSLKPELSEFFEENPLAREVALSRESYTYLVSEAVRRYSTEEARERIPILDPKFDASIVATIDSMNQVGLPPRVNPQDFTTRRVNENLDTMHTMPQSLGLLSAGVSYLALSILDEQVATALSAIVYTNTSLGLKRESLRGFEERVKQLSLAAARTDKYLRAIYPKAFK